MTMKRRLFVSFGIGLVTMLGVSGLRSIARAQAPAAPVEPAATTAPPPAPVAAAPVAAPDPTGDNTGTAADVTVKDAKAPKLDEVMATVGHSKIATEKSHALDVFYVTDARGGKLDADEMSRLEAALAAALDPRRETRS